MFLAAGQAVAPPARQEGNAVEDANKGLVRVWVEQIFNANFALRGRVWEDGAVGVLGQVGVLPMVGRRAITMAIPSRAEAAPSTPTTTVEVTTATATSCHSDGPTRRPRRILSVVGSIELGGAGAVPADVAQQAFPSWRGQLGLSGWQRWTRVGA
jgi:hypothetical protein